MLLHVGDVKCHHGTEGVKGKLEGCEIKVAEYFHQKWIKRQTSSSLNDHLGEGHYTRRMEMRSFSGTQLIKDDDNEVLEEIERYQDCNSDLPMETHSTRTQ